jgi:hypothetical protein
VAKPSNLAEKAQKANRDAKAKPLPAGAKKLAVAQMAPTETTHK